MRSGTDIVTQESCHPATRAARREIHHMRLIPGLAAFSAVGMALVLALSSASPATAVKPPTGRTYFVVSVGVATDRSEAYEVSAGCISFTATQICRADPAGGLECGTWQRTATGPQARKQGSFDFQFSLIDDETGLPIEVDGRGRFDARGKRSSIGGAARGSEATSGRVINMALAGRAVRPARCLLLVEEFEAGNL